MCNTVTWLQIVTNLCFLKCFIFAYTFVYKTTNVINIIFVHTFFFHSLPPTFILKLLMIKLNGKLILFDTNGYELIKAFI